MAKPEPLPPPVFYLRREILKVVEEAVAVTAVFVEDVHTLFRLPAPECGPGKTRTVILTLHYHNTPADGRRIVVTGDLGRIKETFKVVERVGVE